MENSICDQFKDYLKEFKDWVETQPQLPQNLSKSKNNKREKNHSTCLF